MADLTRDAENAVAAAADEYDHCPCVDHADELDEAIRDLTLARVQ